MKINFGMLGNDIDHILDGWSGAESGFRWALGSQSALRLPELRGVEQFVLTFRITPARLPDELVQAVIVLVKDSVAARFEVREQNTYAVCIHAEVFRSPGENAIRFLYRHHADPNSFGSLDQRELSVAFHELSLHEAPFIPAVTPRFLPIPIVTQEDSEIRKNLAERFQSLGQNCEFGLWQRQCGAEPYGLLRFASIYLHKLIHGVNTNFEGIDDPAQLTLKCSGSNREYIGHHDFYGLDYHTRRFEGKVKCHGSLMANESARLGYLARMLIEDMEIAGKIFVVHSERALIPELVLPLLLALRTHNPNVRLLYVTVERSGYSSLIGRVEECASGLFHGYLRRFAPHENAHDLDFDSWTTVCSTLAEAFPN